MNYELYSGWCNFMHLPCTHHNLFFRQNIACRIFVLFTLHVRMNIEHTKSKQ